MPRIPSLLSAAALASVTTLAACGGDDHDAKFTGASTAQIQRAYDAASTNNAGEMIFIGLLLSGADAPESCPSIRTTGATTTVSGGCTTEEGDRWDGSITIENFPGFFTENPAYDPSARSKVTLDVRITAAGGERTRVDGSVEIDPAGPVTADLLLDWQGITTDSHAVYRCEDGGEGGGSCTIQPGASVSVSGVGSAAAEGTFAMDPPSGRITLKGAETLVFDLAAATESCVPYSIDGRAAGELCDRDDDFVAGPRARDGLAGLGDRLRAAVGR